MDYQELTPEQLLGPLNEGERKNAPAKLFIAGNRGEATTVLLPEDY